MRIGISVLSHAGQNIWENGMGQNVVFLAQTFRAIPFVTSVVLIDAGDQGRLPDAFDLENLGLRLLTQQQALDEVDVVMELAGALDPAWMALQRARGKKIVHYCVGHPYAAVVEAAVFERPGGFFKPDRADEVWTLPVHAAFTSFQRVLHRCPVREVPYLWSPKFLQQRIAEAAAQGHPYGWVADEKHESKMRPLRVAIFEPNISVVKTSNISMLACDEAYRRNQHSVGMMHVLNSVHMKDHPSMLYFANSLDLVQQHKACFHGRHDIVGFMAQYADAVVSHQWTNDQNYSYMDALFGDYPLIHNSAWLHSFGAGYFYPQFDAAEGGRQLLLAAAEHDARLSEQRQAAQRVFAAVDPLSGANVKAYEQLLRQLCENAPQLLEAV